MATTPYFLWPAQSSSAAASDLMAGIGFSAQEESAPALAATTGPMDMAPLHASELSEAVARPRLRRQASSGSGRQQGAGTGNGGTPKKPPQRGLGVAELERLRCGDVDPLQDLNVAAAAAMLEAVAAAASAQGNPVLLHHQHHQDHLPAFDAATGARYYSPLLVQPPTPAPARYVHGMAPEQQYFMDRWGRVGGFLPAGNAGAVGGHLQQLQAQAPEQPSSQNTIWRPAPSSASSCLHAGHRCDLCSKTVRAMPEKAQRAPAPAPAATTTTMQDYSIYNLAAAMTASRKEPAGDGWLPREAKKEVREIEFFPTSAANHADESEFATAVRRTTPFPSATPSIGGYAAPLDLSLRL
ncbi:hypothetical protein ACQ4PT_070903 [Festuca glaucescens]